MLSAALKLASAGLAIFPCRVRDKRPATGSGLKDATCDPEQIRTWWDLDPNFNVAIATGAVSKIFVVDVDGSDAEHELQQLELPTTVETITARGKHLYFKYPPDTAIRNTAGKIAPGIDTRGDGGYVLAPPSIHPSGARYRWAGARTVAVAPGQLIAKITERSNGHASPSELSDLFTDIVREGCRNDTIARLAGFLIRRRVGVSATGALLRG